MPGLTQYTSTVILKNKSCLSTGLAAEILLKDNKQSVNNITDEAAKYPY